MTSLADLVRIALDAVPDPLTRKGLVSSGRVTGLVVREDGKVGFALETTVGEADEPLRLAAERAAAAVPGVSRVTAVLTGDAPPGAGQPSVRIPPPDARREVALRPEARPQQQTGPQTKRPARWVIAVASAKGGVGKSTVAVNLAVAAMQKGLRVGLLDADIHGPSLPTMMATEGQKPEATPDRRMRPIPAHGLATLSIGNLVDPEKAVAWRGPMATGAIVQMLQDTDWGELDLLVIDTPPGTGEIILTLVQRLPLDGVVIVSTPQEVALADVRRGVALFRKTEVPVLGVIENMAWFEESDGRRVFIFGQGGAERTALEAGVPFLGALPILPSLREGGDVGRPAALSPGVAREAFAILAAAVLDAVAAEPGKPAPTIRFT
jgi:ATP-binding protein involved in chromosome partitioning